MICISKVIILTIPFSLISISYVFTVYAAVKFGLHSGVAQGLLHLLFSTDCGSPPIWPPYLFTPQLQLRPRNEPCGVCCLHLCHPCLESLDLQLVEAVESRLLSTPSSPNFLPLESFISVSLLPQNIVPLLRQKRPHCIPLTSHLKTRVSIFPQMSRGSLYLSP